MATSAVTHLLCPACRTSYDAAANFCPRCGASLHSEPAPQPGAEEEPDEIDPLLGRLIDGRYRVIERIGSGGMGVVYRVEHQRMGKIAAMKVLHRDLASDSEVTKRFRREAEAISQLTHPNTVQTFDFGTTPDGVLYLVMELVRGEDLGTIVKRDGALTFRRAAPIFLQTCGALGEAHELGIIHRDLKPENLLVSRTKDGHDHVKVLDFGLAKLTEREESADVTGKGEVIGTPYYMSPEQIRGEDLDLRSDIYSLGAVMYRALSGQPVFTAKTPMGVLTRHLSDEPTPLGVRVSGIDPRIEAVVMRCLAKRPEDRFASADALREALEPLYEDARTTYRAPSDGGVGPTPTPPRMENRGRETLTDVKRLRREEVEDFERGLRRRKLLLRTLVPLVLVAGGVAGVVWWKRQETLPRQREVEPNNDLASATLIAPGQKVEGRIARRIGPDQGDRDFYLVWAQGQPGAPRRLSARLDPLPNMDLALAVYDETGKLLAVADALGMGEAEVIPNLRVTAGKVYLAVLESREGEKHAPTENLSDYYGLTVNVGDVRADEELEPNDVIADATPLKTSMKGYLGRPQDVDRYRFAGAVGIYEVEVTGAATVTMRLRLPDGATAKGRKAKVALKPGDLLSVERVDEVMAGGRMVARGVDLSYTITVRKSGG
jgi:eukaryotic-like serine/threonine-protein kinase